MDVALEVSGVADRRAGRASRDALAVLVAGALGASSTAWAQPSADELREANNPLASTKAVNVQGLRIPKLYGLPNDESANQLLIRAAVPFDRWLTRLTIPVVTASGGGDPESGLGDASLFATFLLKSDAKLSFGIGPQLTAPSASEDVLGAGKWQGGLAAVAFYAPNEHVQLGGLVTWQKSFAGDDDRADTNLLAIQPFAMWQLGNGTYLRSTATWTFDLENDTYAIPIGLGIGKVTKSEKIVFNFFIEPQVTVLHRGAGQPELQIFSGINMQF